LAGHRVLGKAPGSTLPPSASARPAIARRPVTALLVGVVAIPALNLQLAFRTTGPPPGTPLGATPTSCGHWLRRRLQRAANRRFRHPGRRREDHRRPGRAEDRPPPRRRRGDHRCRQPTGGTALLTVISINGPSDAVLTVGQLDGTTACAASVFWSLLVPIMATSGFLLSAAASFRAVVAIFQWGLGRRPASVERTGADLPDPHRREATSSTMKWPGLR
jgi:hypothetical protein